MEFLFYYGLFLAETVTLVVAVAVLLMVVIGAVRGGGDHDEHLIIKDLAQQYEHIATRMRHATMDKKARKADAKARKKQAKTPPEVKKTVYVIDFKGDLRASAAATLREEISALLAQASEKDGVILRLENAGGTVHEHGLAASQLARLRERNIHLTVCVDKIAASGGYLMACTANHLIAAPFAILGSIGVIVSMPNFHRLLEHHGVDFEQYKGGKYKRTVTMFGENTEADREKLRDEINVVHQQFKDFVVRYRQKLDIDKVATGEYWLGQQALELALCDAIGTSDDALLTAVKEKGTRLLHLSYQRKISFMARLGLKAQPVGDAVINGLTRFMQRLSALWQPSTR